jgi:hypothetical protein
MDDVGRTGKEPRTNPDGDVSVCQSDTTFPYDLNNQGGFRRYIVRRFCGARLSLLSYRKPAELNCGNTVLLMMTSTHIVRSINLRSFFSENQYLEMSNAVRKSFSTLHKAISTDL